MFATDCESLRESMRCVAALLRSNDLPYALAGSMAVWARGGPDVYHDIDFVVLENDVEQMLDIMRAAGMKTDRPPPEWLCKTWDGGNLIDLIFRPAIISSQTAIENAEDLVVQSMRMPVMTVDDVVIMKLGAMTEQHMDYTYLLQLTRSTREQLNWDYIERMTKDSIFAEAFLVLARGIGIRP